MQQVYFCRLEYYDLNSDFGHSAPDQYQYTISTPQPTEYKDIHAESQVRMLFQTDLEKVLVSCLY